MKVTEDYVFFYGNADYPSNFYYSPYCLYGYEFPTVEHGFQWAKAVHFKDEETATRILETDCPKEAKRLGRLVKGYNDEVWKALRIHYMVQHVSQKFIQNPDIYRQAIEEVKNGRQFVEASKVDVVWGIGLWDNEAMKVDSNAWPGENLLGQLITSFFRGEMTRNVWYQNNWAWFDKEPPEEVDEENSNDEYFLAEDDDDE